MEVFSGGILHWDFDLEGIFRGKISVGRSSEGEIYVEEKSRGEFYVWERGNLWWGVLPEAVNQKPKHDIFF